VNLAVLVIGIALVSLLIGAPTHAAYRNSHPFEEGRNFYRSAAFELTKQWRRLSNEPLSAVSGNDALAFATAFYSPDHPVYARSSAYQHTWGLPGTSIAEKGWAALCFADQGDCIEWIRSASARASRFIRWEFVAHSTLLGRTGVERRVIALIVPPQLDEVITPMAGTSNAGDFSAKRRTAAPSE
jgi:hypothetical protein